MKHNHRSPLLASTFIMIFATACSSLSGIGGSGSGNFPRTADPIAVSVVLDTERAVSNADMLDPGIGYGVLENGTTADGIDFSLMTNGAMFSQDEAGNLSLVLGTPVTVTPLSSIDGLPFSQGYLAAVHIAPDGMLLEMSGTLSMTLPAVYDVSTLIGFAADGTGADFHLFPITAFPDSSGGTTSIYFDINHFSLYGVAQATAQEVSAVAAHPPANPASQDEEDLAPLTPILYAEDLAPLPTKVQLQLGKSYDRMVKPYLSKIDSLPCNQVDVAAYQLNAWKGRVDAAGQSEHFQQQINQAATSLLARLTECAKVTCESCLNPASGSSLDSASINHLLVLASFAGDMASILELHDESSFWTRLMIECSSKGGLPPLYVSTGGDCSGSGCVTPPPLTCK